MKKILLYLGFIYMGICVVLITIGSIFSLINNSYSRRYVKTEAIIVNIVALRQTKCDVYVEYYYLDGDEIYQNTTKLNYFHSSMRVGDEITIYYEPDNPTVIHYENYLVSIILQSIGAIFGLIASIFMVILFSIEHKESTLKTNGKKVICTIISVNINKLISINKCHPSYIICEYLDELNNKRYEYHSHSVFDISLADSKSLADFIGKKINVYVSRKNEKSYFVDTKSIFTEGMTVETKNGTSDLFWN